MPNTCAIQHIPETRDLITSQLIPESSDNNEPVV